MSASKSTMKKRISLVWVLVAAILGVSFAGALAAEADSGGPVRTVADLNGKRLGVIAGTILDNAANNVLDFTQIVYFDDGDAVLRALLDGEIDAMIDDEPVVRYLVAKDKRLRRVGLLEEDRYGFALRYDDNDLYEQVDAALGGFIGDGTVDALEKKWIDSVDDAERVMPDLPDQPAGPTLRMGVSPVSAPFLYRSDKGEIVGMDLELMQLIARRIDRRLVVVDMEFSELIPSLLSGRVDVIGSCLSITEERSKIIHFTREYYEGGVTALALSHEPEDAEHTE